MKLDRVKVANDIIHQLGEYGSSYTPELGNKTLEDIAMFEDDLEFEELIESLREKYGYDLMDSICEDDTVDELVNSIMELDAKLDKIYFTAEEASKWSDLIKEAIKDLGVRINSTKFTVDGEEGGDYVVKDSMLVKTQKLLINLNRSLRYKSKEQNKPTE